jgi:hypothetical protein
VQGCRETLGNSLLIIWQRTVSELPVEGLEPSPGPTKRVSKWPDEDSKIKLSQTQPIYLIQFGIYSVQLSYLFQQHVVIISLAHQQETK